MLVKIDVKTPKNQAAQCMKTQKSALLGYKQLKKVKEEKVVSHDNFYWVLQLENQKELDKVIKRCSLGEVMIKRFYSSLFKLVHRANRLCAKFGKAKTWIKKWMLKRIKKKYQGDTTGMENYIQNMSDEEFEDFLQIDDEAEMRKLLEGDLITPEILEDEREVAVA